MTKNTSIMSLFAEFINDEVELLILQKIIENESNDEIVNQIISRNE